MRDPLGPIASQSELRLIRAPWAPGLVLAFARWRGDLPALSPLGSGAGTTAAEARQRALGELAENLSLAPAAHAGPVPAHDAAGGVVLADARALPGTTEGLGSEGVAAGPSAAAAQLAALCERAERAALALWWQGALQAQAAPDATCLPLWRGGAVGRQVLTLALDLLPGLAVRLVVTCDPDGARPVLGSAAHPEPETAAAAALREALQAELAWLMPDHHPDRPERDWRAHGLSLRMSSLRASARAPRPASPVAAPEPPAALDQLISALKIRGLRHGFADLTLAALAVPVWRFVCPDWPLARPLLRPPEAQPPKVTGPKVTGE